MTGSLHSLGRAARFVAISGEPGIGKTRLLEELGRRAEERDAVVLIGRGAELERDLPFGVWIDALDDHADWLGPERLQRMLGDRVGELARVLPSVTAATPAAPLALQDERYRAHRAVRALLERLAAANPVIVLLDDLQWADDSSLELVAHLLRRPPHARLVMAVAYRSGGLPSPVLAAFEAAGRDGMVVDVALSPLTSDEADVLLGEELSPRVREELYRLSGGNPFYLEQLAQPAAAPGDGAAAAAPAGTEVPAAVAAALGQELAALSEPARRLAQGASVAGDPAGLELAAAAGELGDAELGAALDELVASRLIAPAAAPRRYRFRHPIVRRAAYESAGPGWRLGAHARAAAALEHMGGPLSARAHHLERCAAPGDEAAIAVLAQAGHAAAPSAPAEAARWYIAALGLLPAEDPGRRLELLVPLATALASTGRLEEALATLLDLLGLIPPELAELRARLVAGCAACENLLGRHGEAHARLERALAELPDQTGAAAAALEAELAADALYDSDFAALAERAQRARASADALGDPGLQALTAALDCFAHYGAGRIPAALEAAAAAAATLDALSDEQLAARLDAPYYLGFAEFLCDRFDAAIRHLRRGLEVSRATGQGQFVVPTMVGLAHALDVRGELDEALDTVSGAVEAGRLSGNRQVLAWALVGEAYVAAMTGDAGRAERAAQEGVELLGELAPSILTLAVHGLAANVFLEVGEVERCLAEAGAAGAPDFPAVEPGRAAWLLAVLARAELARGRLEEATEQAARARARVAGLELPLTEVSVAHAEALIALEGGDGTGAAARAETAAALADGRGRRGARGADALARGPRAGAGRRARRGAGAAQERRGGAGRVRRGAAAGRGGARAAPPGRAGGRASAPRRGRRGPLGAERARDRDRRPRRPGPDQPRDRRRAVRVGQDRRGSPAQRLRQARRHVARGGGGGRRPGTRRRGLTGRQAFRKPALGR